MNLLDLEPIDEDVFRGRSPQIVAAAGLRWSGRRAGAGRGGPDRRPPTGRCTRCTPTSFGPATRPSRSCTEVERVRDGRSFTTRRVVAVQHGKTIFALVRLVPAGPGGIEHQLQMPDVPDPETLPTLRDRYEATTRSGRDSTRGRPRPIDIRYVDDPPWTQRSTGPRLTRRIACGCAPTAIAAGRSAAARLRADLRLGPDAARLRADPARVGRSDRPGQDRVARSRDVVPPELPRRRMVPLRHESPSASGGRGLAEGKIFARDGRHIVSVVQEGMLRCPALRA